MTEPPLTTRAQAEADLFHSRGDACLFAPIRHHSPACAWMLRAMIADHRPDLILIEAPSDLAHHLPHIHHPDTVPPVAIVALGAPGQDGARTASYMPFSETSPEYVAITEAARIGAEVRFIDLPSGRRDDDRPLFHGEEPFDSAAFIAASCAKLGLRDGAELWDHLFETRLGGTDWRRFFADVHAYCLSLRETTPLARIAADDTLAREAAMRGHIAAAGGARMIVVTGGFHTPALIAPAPDDPPPPKATRGESYLIGYGEEALDALSGYAAGLRFPGWYARAWGAANAAGGPPDWTALLRDTGAGLARAARARGRPIALPQMVETLALAQGLARLKGRDQALLPDIFDAARTALIKGEATADHPQLAALADHLRGTRLGAVTRAAGQPPIVADARDRAARARIDLTDSTRIPRKLDIRRKPAHRATSQFLHQMALLGAGFATWRAGPDFVTGARTDLLFEEWEIGWSPFVEGRLIDAARLGATVPRAAAAKLTQDRAALYEAGRGDDPGALLNLLLTGLRAGLGATLGPLRDDLATAVDGAGDIGALAGVILRLQGALMPGDPLHDADAPDLPGLAARAYDRALWLCDDLPDSPDDALDPAIEGLGVLAGVLRGPHADRFDAARFDTALADVLAARRCPPLLAGAVAGLLTRAGRLAPSDLARLLRGTLAGIGTAPIDRAAALDGVLRTAPMLLWQDRAVLDAAEEALAGLGDDAFLAALPALRRSLTRLDPHQTDRLAEEVAAMIGGAAGTLTAPSRFDAGMRDRALALDAEIARTLAADAAP